MVIESLKIVILKKEREKKKSVILSLFNRNIEKKNIITRSSQHTEMTKKERVKTKYYDL